MNKETALRRWVLRGAVVGRKRREPCGILVMVLVVLCRRTQDTVLYKVGKTWDISREILNGEKLVSGVLQYECLGRRCERKGGKGTVCFFISPGAESALL